MKVVVCSNAFLPATREGGVPFSTYNFCRALAGEGAAVSVVTTNRDGAGHLSVETDRWSRFEGLPVWYARSGRDPYFFAPSAAQALATAPADLIVSSGTLWTHLGWLAWRASRRAGIPSLAYVRGLLAPRALAVKPIRKRCYWRAVGERLLRDTSLVVALAEQEKAILEAAGVRTPIEVIPNAVSVRDHIRPVARERLAELSPTLVGGRYLLFLGRVHEQKGLDVLLRAFARVAPQLPGLRLVVAGPVHPGFASRLEALLEHCEQRAPVVLTGAVEGPIKNALLQHAEAFVLPSYWEGLPTAALEAMASRCPVIVSRSCNLPQVVGHCAGLEVDPEEGQLGEAIRRLVSDRSLRAEMAVNAHALACREFDLPVVGRRLLEVCRSLTAPPAARGDSSPRASVLAVGPGLGARVQLALCRVFSWLSHRFLGGRGLHRAVPLIGQAFSRRNFAIFRTAGGRLFQVPLRDRYLVPRLVGPGRTYEPEVGLALEQVLDGASAFIDCGANLGWWSLCASVTIRDRGRILAVEPVADNFGGLRENARLNEEPFTCVNATAWSEDGAELPIFFTPGRLGSASLRPRWSGRPASRASWVRSVTLDSLIDRYLMGPKTNVVVKVDVEGAELAVLEGLRRHLPAVAAIIYEDHAKDPDSKVTAAVLARGFDVLYFDESGRSRRIRSVEEACALKRNRHQGCNFLAVPSRARRLAGAGD